MAGYDISLLIGQSNTAGRGEPFSLTTDPINPMIGQFGAKGRAIVPASEPLDMNEATTRGIGPGLQWARHYVSKGRNNDRPVLLVPAARGGTPLVNSTGTTWNPNTTGSLLDQALQQLDEAIAAAGPGSRVVTALWIQGETDGDQNRTRAQYQALLDQLIAKVRTHVGDDRLPFIVGGMVPMYLTTGTRAQIDQAHRDTPRRVDMTAFSEAPPEVQYSDLDGNHFNAAGQRVIGLRMFDAWESLVPPGPRPGGGGMSLVTVTGNVWDHGRKVIPAAQKPELYFRPERAHINPGLMHGDSVKASLNQSTGSFSVELESKADDGLVYVPWVRWLVDPSTPDAFGYYEFPTIWPDSGGNIGDLTRPSKGWCYCSPRAPIKDGTIRAEFQYNTTTTSLYRRGL